MNDFGNIFRRLEGLEKRLATVEQRLAAPPPPAETWKLWMVVRSKALFRSSTGKLEAVPTALLDLIAGQEAFDGQVLQRKDRAAFLAADGKEIASVPQTLAAVLDKEHLTMKGVERVR